MQQAPKIHLNGSGRASLHNSFTDVLDKLNLAELALRNCRPHMRDYYVYPNGGTAQFLKAQEEHMRRETRVLENIREMNEILHQI